MLKSFFRYEFVPDIRLQKLNTYLYIYNIYNTYIQYILNFDRGFLLRPQLLNKDIFGGARAVNFIISRFKIRFVKVAKKINTRRRRIELRGSLG